jgi:hypothetical protein
MKITHPITLLEQLLKNRLHSVCQQLMPTTLNSMLFKHQVLLYALCLLICTAPRRILGGKDLNTHQTPFRAPPPTIKPFDTHEPDAWSPPFTRPTHRRHSRKSSLGIRISPVKVVPAPDVEVEDVEYMPPTAVGITFQMAYLI